MYRKLFQIEKHGLREKMREKSRKERERENRVVDEIEGRERRGGIDQE
jgi:hypothetical protein